MTSEYLTRPLRDLVECPDCGAGVPYAMPPKTRAACDELVALAEAMTVHVPPDVRRIAEAAIRDIKRRLS